MKAGAKRILIVGLAISACVALLLLVLSLSRRDDGYTYVNVTANEFTLQNRDGETMGFSYGETSGDLEVGQASRFSEGLPTMFELLQYSEEYVFTTEQERVEIAIETKDWAQAFDGSGVDTARFVGNDGMELNGEDIFGTVSINYPEEKIYTPFRLSLHSEDSLSVKTTDTGIDVQGISDAVPVRASYHPAGNSDIQFTYVTLGSFSGSISIDLSGLESGGHIIITSDDGSQKTVNLH